MKAERVERAAAASTSFLDSLDPARKRELIAKGTEFLHERGVEGMVCEVPVPTHLTRTQRRQVARELGARGTKAKRHKPNRLVEVQNALLVDQVLGASKARMEMGTIERTRLRISERRAS